MQYRAPVDVLCSMAQDLVRLRKVCNLAEDFWKLLKCCKYVWNTFLLQCFDCLVCLGYITVTLPELIKNFFYWGSASNILSGGLRLTRLSPLHTSRSVECILPIRFISTRHASASSRWAHGASGSTTLTSGGSSCVYHVCRCRHHIWLAIPEEVILSSSVLGLALTSSRGLILKILSTCVWALSRILKGLTRWNASSSHIFLLLFCTYKCKWRWLKPRFSLLVKLRVFKL